MTDASRRYSSGTTTLGLDIGTSVVKLVVARSISGRVSIRHAGAFATTFEMAESGVVRNPRALGKQIREWAKATGIEALPTVFSVPSSAAALRWVSLPPVSGEERRGAAMIKVRRHLPFPVESAYIEATDSLESPEERGKQSLVIAVPRPVIDSRAEAIMHAGFQPVAAELEAQAVLRVVEQRLSERGALWRNASLTIIDVGGRNTHMYVVQNQTLQFIRSVKFGSHLIASALANALDISLEDAQEHLSQQKTVLRQDGTVVIETEELTAIANIATELSKLVREFLRLLRYFRSLHPERSYAGILDHLVLCGGLVGLRGFAEYLGENLGLRVETARPFTGMLAEVDAEGFREVSRRQETYTVSVGLAVSAIEHSEELKGGNEHECEFHWKRAV